MLEVKTKHYTAVSGRYARVDGKMLLCVILCIMLLSGSLYAATYYVSPNGNDANPGTYALPWQTLEYVSAQAQAGDTIKFLPGDYPGELEPLNSGTSANPIVFEANEPLTVRLTGFPTEANDMLECDESDPNGAGYMPVDRDFHISVIGRSYLKFNGLHVQPGVMVQTAYGTEGGQENFWLYIYDSNYIEINNCVMEGAPIQDVNMYAGGSVLIRQSSQIKLLDSVFRNKRRSDMIWVTFVDGLLIEGCEIGRTGHAPLRIDSLPIEGSCRNIVIRGNVFNATWCRPIDFEFPKYVLFENNTMVNAFNGGQSATSSCNNGITRGIVRFNQFYRNWGEPFKMIYAGAGAEFMSGVYYYNNVWDKNCRTSHVIRNHWNKIKNTFYVNNCFTGNTTVEGNVQLEIEPYSTSTYVSRFYNNIITGSAPGLSNTIRYGKTGYPETYAYYDIDRYAAEVADPNEFIGNLDVDPCYADPDNYNYAPETGSPMIDGGTFFTYTTNAGTSTTSVPVPPTEARYFYDGYDTIDGEEGDWIRIGNELRQVTDVNAGVSPAIITVSSPVSFDANTPISLRYSGNAPDIGLYEANGTGARPSVQIVVSNANCAPGTQITLTAVCRGFTAASYEWQLGDGTTATSSSVQHVYTDNYNYAVRLKVTDANDLTYRATAVVFVETPKMPNEPLMAMTFDANDQDWWWKIKQYRPATAVYRYYPDSPGYTKVYARSIDDPPYSLVSWIHPPAWNIDEYPIIRLRLRIGSGTPIGIFLLAFGKRQFDYTGDTNARRVCIAQTSNAVIDESEMVDGNTPLVSDGSWHEYTLDARLIRERYPCEMYLEGLHIEAAPTEDAEAGDYYDLDYLFIEPDLLGSSDWPYGIVGDINHDCRVDLLDQAMMLENWMVDCTYPNNLTEPACQQ